MGLSDYLVTDELTIVLGLVAAGLFLLHNLYKPQSLVHPILLGRQSDAARVRNAGESAVYRNYGTGMLGRFPARPTKDQQVLLDLVNPDLDTPRTLWSTRIANPELRKRISSFAAGLVHVVGIPHEDSNVLLLLNDGIEFLVADMALASRAIPSFTLTSQSLLSPCLEEHTPSAIITDAEFLPQLLELVYDMKEGSHYPIIVVGEPKVRADQAARLHKWEDVERQGAQLSELPPIVPDPKQVFSVSFYASSTGELRGAQLTHENVTAGVAAVRTLLPPSGTISPLDTMVSAHSLSAAYGRAVAYTAVFEGANFATFASSRILDDGGFSLDVADIDSAKKYPVPSPTILFLKPFHLSKLTSSILETAKKSSFILYSMAWRHKLSGIMEGFTTKQSLWDRLVFDGARVAVMGEGAGTVRGVIVSGGPLENQILTPARVALSVPLVNTYTHPLVSGPVLASHPLDLQTFPNEQPSSSSKSAAENYTFTYVAPVGPPAVNVEAKLTGIDEDAIENGGDPVGTLFIRGPSVGAPLGAEEIGEEAWVATEDRARVLPNGTFKVVVAEAKNI